MRLIKNTSTQVISILMTEHPISNQQEWAETDDVLEKGDIQREFMAKQMAKKPNLRTKLSKQTPVVITPGDTVRFGEDGAYNDEQGEYLYRQLGQPEFGGYDASGKKVINENFLIEVDDDGKEVKGLGSLFRKYRGTQPSPVKAEGKIEQFVIPNAKT